MLISFYEWETEAQRASSSFPPVPGTPAHLRAYFSLPVAGPLGQASAPCRSLSVCYIFFLFGFSNGCKELGVYDGGGVGEDWEKLWSL